MSSNVGRFAAFAFCLVNFSGFSSSSAQEFTMDIVGPETIVTAGPITTIEFRARLSSANVTAELGAQAWSLGTVASGGNIVEATTSGTAGASVDDDPPGMRSAGFEHTELTSGEGNAGAVSAVVLSFDQAISLPRDGTAEIFVVTVDAPSPESGCVDVSVDFSDKLAGIGEPVQMKVIYQGSSLVPMQIGITTQICSYPDIAVAPDALEFGGLILDESRTLTAQVTNSGFAPLVLGSIALEAGSSSTFRLLTNPEGQQVMPQETALVEIEYRPQDEQADAGRVRIASDDPDEPEIFIDLSGTGLPVPAPLIEVSPTNRDFGKVFIGRTSTATLRVRNVGTAELRLLDVRFSPESSDSFTITAAPNSAIAPDGESTIEVEFKPTNLESVSADLLIESDDEKNSLIAVQLGGQGSEKPLPDIRIEPSELDFGEVIVGETVRRTFLISNEGEAPLDIASIVLGAGSDSSFVREGPTSARIVAGLGSAEIEIIFTPRAEGLLSATLLIDSNDPVEPMRVVEIQGTGTLIPEPQFLRGDGNSDGDVDISDSIVLFDYLFLGGREPGCFDAADSNDDADVDIADGVYNLNYLFLDGPPTPPPGLEDCGPDPTADTMLECLSAGCP